jgi:hypothetical protein
VSDTRSEAESPSRPPDLERRTLTTFGYLVATVVPVLIAAVGLTILHFNYDPEDNVDGERVPLLVSNYIPGQDTAGALIAGDLTLDDDGCVRLLQADGSELTAVWPAGWEATQVKGDLRLYDTDRSIVAQGGDSVQMGGTFEDVGSYAGRPCAPDSGRIALVQSDVTVTARG